MFLCKFSTDLLGNASFGSVLSNSNASSRSIVIVQDVAPPPPGFFIFKLNLFHLNLAPLRYEQPIVKQPKFPLTFWNMWGRVQTDLPRSQAAMEATHQTLQVFIWN